MNIERLEMVRTMMGRIIANSWVGTETVMGGEITYNGCNMVDKAVVVTDFDLSSWRGKDYHHKDPAVCGFTACAVGHMCFDPEFRKMGWFWELGNDGYGFAEPSFKGNKPWESIRTFFDIDQNDPEYGIGELLFFDESYVTYENGEFINMPGAHAQLVFDRLSDLIEIGADAFLKKHADVLAHLEGY